MPKGQYHRVIESPIAKILHNVKTDKNGCWIWQGSLDSSGYPQVRDSQGVIQAHRLLVGRYDSNEFIIQRTCNNKRCLNPNHLKLVRIQKQKRLTYNEAQKIRHLFFNEDWSNNALSKKFKVTPAAITRIISNQAHKRKS